VPKRLVEAIDHVDEIWTGSQFIADAFAAVTDKPVTCVPLPVAEPKPSARTRATMGIPDDHYVFLTTFDQFSVPERKNPFGTIEAFTRAFTDGEGPLLLIKTMNGDRGWKNHERLLLAAAGRTDIVIWDEHLTRADQMAVLANVDCLVSLHRSEGLGLHCAEAMWLSKPVIATRYSGNLDFMDDTVAAMIDYTYVNVRHGEGIYPETAMWADPDLGQAAAWMRRLVDEPTVGRELGVRARQRMQQQPTMADTGRLMARLAGLQ
jgi:glycosyltransferase involved in cell wall biosynthesis